VTDLNFYLPNEVDDKTVAQLEEAGVEIPKTSSGYVDLVKLLYASNQTTFESPYSAYDSHELTDSNYIDV